jgi:hypothetical protein
MRVSVSVLGETLMLIVFQKQILKDFLNLRVYNNIYMCVYIYIYIYIYISVVKTPESVVERVNFIFNRGKCSVNHNTFFLF